MCHEYTKEETANVLDALADLFAWKRRQRLVEAAAALRLPGLQWPQPAGPQAEDAAGNLSPERLPGSRGHQTA